MIPTADPFDPHNMAMTPRKMRQRHAFSAPVSLRPGRRAHLLALMGALLLSAGGCGLENAPGAVGTSTQPDPAATTAQWAADPSTDQANRDAAAEAANGQFDAEWYEVQMSEQVAIWLPRSSGWQIAGPNPTAGGAMQVVLSNPAAGAELQVTAQPLASGQTAATLCTATLSALLDAVDSQVVPQTIGNPAPGASWVDASDCAANGVASDEGSIDYRMAAIVRQSDGTAYLQSLRIAPGGQNDLRQQAIALNDELLRRALDELDQR